MRITPFTQQAAFIERRNRFAALVELAGEPTLAHLANSGRLVEVLVPGAPVLLAERYGGHRKTRYDLIMAAVDGQWVSVNTWLPNNLVQEALQANALEPFRAYPIVKREVVFGHSRIDFLLEGAVGRYLLEVKSLTLVRDGTALFPDAPTLRGRRHVQTLQTALKSGYQAGILFVIQRPDATTLAPNEAIDPSFAQALRQAYAAGVELYAYRCQVSPQEVKLDTVVPIRL